MADPSRLADRLRRIQGLETALPKSPRLPSEARRVPAGWEQRAPHLWTRQTSIPNPLSANRPLRLLTSDRSHDGELCFLDTETTGLSGGAGTIAFLVGLGRPAGSEFRVTQYFVADYPGEGDLVEALDRELSDTPILVSYNGKSFDLPILRSRFALNGRELPVGAQIDLLHAARRLWADSIGSCSLNAIEDRVLGVERTEDVPGYLVPELYFEYLRSWNADLLQPVFSHHLYDIVSLASLLDHIETIPNRPPGSGGVNTVELGRLMIDRGMSSGVDLLRSCALSGSLRAARAVTLPLKRMGRWGEAVEIWRSLWEASSSYFAGVELAKFYEHRVRDYPRALELVEKMAALPFHGTPWAEAARAETAHRRRRLLRKLGRG